jgi:hypothetical protein
VARPEARTASGGRRREAGEGSCSCPLRSIWRGGQGYARQGCGVRFEGGVGGDLLFKLIQQNVLLFGVGLGRLGRPTRRETCDLPCRCRLVVRNVMSCSPPRIACDLLFRLAQRNVLSFGPIFAGPKTLRALDLLRIERPRRLLIWRGHLVIIRSHIER